MAAVARRRVIVPPAIAPLPSPPPAAETASLHGETMGTTWSVRLVVPPGRDLGAIRAGIQGRLDRVVAAMSPWLAGSDLCRFNAAPAGTWQALPPALHRVLAAALAMARASGGAYDPTVGPLVDLWGFGPAGPRDAAPTAAAIAAARARVGWQRIELDGAGRARHPGQAGIDLCAIAKGFAVDDVAAWLARGGIGNVLVEVGGELSGRGVKPDGRPWWVAVEAPPDARGLDQTVVALHGLSVATSGDYRRFFDDDSGVRRAHTIDPRTGWPAAHPLASVTVVHPSCMMADALATALTVLGPADGPRFARREGIAALFVARDGAGHAETLTPALAAMLD